MHTKVSTDLEFFTSDETFSLDELVLRLKNLFENQAYCSILHAFLDFFQGSLIAQAATEKLAGHEGHRYAKDGTYKKMFRTSLGEFEMKMVRLKDPETRWRRFSSNALLMKQIGRVTGTSCSSLSKLVLRYHSKLPG